MEISKNEIGSFIPQRAPFIMVDHLLKAGDDVYETEFYIDAGNIFVEEGLLREFALLENIAQSCSAGIAFNNSKLREKTVEGFIGAISKLVLYELPRVNDTIRTRVQLLAHLNNMYLLKGECFANGVRLIECEMKLAGK